MALLSRWFTHPLTDMTETAIAKDPDDGRFCAYLENSTFERGAEAIPPESESCDSGLGFSSAWLSAKIFEQRLVWKVDMHVVPWLFLLYLCAFIDRVNIGNAKIEGLEDDLRMTGNDYNIALVAFFIPYILCEFPSNIISYSLMRYSLTRHDWLN
ncbi:hypothetical protein POJ06DRAFT_236988 [Lipomyces tetrasporus]|uniref:Uncharacterized protein n=1 Tax=Lipomyces tetrasporus TaxID=54092 RepID=A0AAD7QVP2_9ASCO|nr:uncharacterized protein POJ06DRAFT_236988 [Lipomyces tetrasporus]KAJ8102379.1 hypothetical protein POJ06DRAFT_236988 [Lipomyces tetrasporus]